MQRVIRALCCAASLTVAFGLASCKPGEESNSSSAPGGKVSSANRRIVFIFKSAGQYSEVCKQGAEQAAKELEPKGIKVEYFAPDKADVAKQIQYMDQLIAQKASAIVISPNDAKAIEPMVKKATAAGVKVFTWDSDAPTSQRVFYVAAADDVKIGVDIANALAKDVGEKGKVMIVSGGRAAANLNLHVQGMEQEFKKNHPGITLVQPYLYNDDNDMTARSQAAQAMQKDPDIVGFACANSPSPPAVGEVVQQTNKIGKVKVWGLSLPSVTKSYLKSGAVSGVMLWDPNKLTYLTAILVNDYLDGKQPKDGAEFKGIGKISVKGAFVIIPGITFTKDNVDQFNF